MFANDASSIRRSEPVVRHGAALPPPVLIYAVLTVLTAVLPATIAGVTPWASTQDLLSFVHDHHGAVRLQAALSLAAAIPLAVLSAVFSDRIRVLGLDVPGRLIALLGGCLAAAMLAASGMATLALLSVHGGANATPTVRFGYGLATALGGTGFAPFAGLLIAGIAVPGLLARMLPRTLAWFGLAITVVAELAVFSSATDALSPLLPVTRFGSAMFLIAAAFTLREPRPAH